MGYGRGTATQQLAEGPAHGLVASAPPSTPAAATSRATTACVSVQPLSASFGSRIRTWFEANVMSPGRTPGSGTPNDGDSSCIAVALESDESVAKSTDERAETVFRIIEEALRNVERHAGAQTVRVGLRSTPDAADRTQVNIQVADDGVGFDTALPRPGHYGLRGIQEQAALIGARLGVFSEPGKGTQVVLAFDT